LDITLEYVLLFGSRYREDLNILLAIRVTYEYSIWHSKFIHRHALPWNLDIWKWKKEVNSTFVIPIISTILYFFLIAFYSPHGLSLQIKP